MRETSLGKTWGWVIKVYGPLEVAQLEWFTDAGKPAAASYAYRVIYITDTTQVVVSDGSNWYPVNNRLNSSVDSSSTGAAAAVAPTTNLIALTNSSLTSVGSLSSPATGAYCILTNETGVTISILDEDSGSTAANRIRTGTGAFISLANNASVHLVYVSNDSRWHVVGGIGSGTSSGTNFIANGSAEADTTGWATYADVAGTSPVDGTGGSPTVTWTRSTSSPLVGTASFVFTKDAANRQGQGASFAFSIDSAYKAKVLQISFEYMVDSGTFVAGSDSTSSDITAWIYDVTNGAVIQPTSFKLFSNSSTLSTTFVSNFQSASNSTSYRLILHVGSTSASAYTVKFDAVTVAPSTYVYGSPLSDWQTYTPTYTGFGTVTGSDMWWRRAGDSIEVKGKFTSGTVTAVAAAVSLPNSFVIDSTKVSSIRQSGTYTTNVSARTTHGGFMLITGGASVVNFGDLSTFSGSSVTNNVLAVNGNAVAVSGDVLFINVISIPITGLASTVQMSSDTDTRVISFTGTQSSQAVTANVTNIAFTTATDKAGAWNGTQYVVPVAGDYLVSGAMVNSAGPHTPGVYVNGTIATNGNFSTIPAASVSSGAILLPNLKSGDLISMRNAATGTISQGQLSIFRLTGPSAIAATETVACTYGLTSAQAVATNGVVKYDTVVFDTHGAYSTVTGLFTVPVAGVYEIAAGHSMNASGGSYIKLNSTAVAYVGTNSAGNYISGSYMLRANAGDTIGIYCDNAATYLATSGNGYINRVTIKRVGI